ncbi:hypothetical protein B0H13DRAFT_2300227 [Mycena leptocephala]|nr:hypothetical protein B0H13DRAFT_2300227 [Mycena leptocephala]
MLCISSETVGFSQVTMPIIVAHRRLIALLGGQPWDLAEWKRITEMEAKPLFDGLERGTFSDEGMHHC